MVCTSISALGVMTSAPPLEHLEDAPIDEVACGVTFVSLAGLDPIMVGSYWRERADEYPGHQLRTPIRNAAALMEVVGEVPPLRTMLISKDEQFVIQVQADRFYLNWRRRGGAYPRFNKREGKAGVLQRAMDEYRAFGQFCARALGAAPVVTGIELAKIDVVREGVYWKDLTQVAEILPCLRDFIGFTASDKPSVLLRFTEPRAGGVVQINVALGESKSARVLTLETRRSRETNAEQVEAAFQEANQELNQVFAGLIPKEQRDKYFNRGRAS
jgi:uncharacterized protein (TIGR04255 family)